MAALWGAARGGGRVRAGGRPTTGVDLGPLARNAAARGAAREKEHDAPDPERARAEAGRAAAMAEAARERSDSLRARVLEGVDLFLAPSRFLRSRLVDEFGLPEARVEYLPPGVDLTHFKAPGVEHARRGAKLRVAFIGTRIPLKGPHVLLEAWKRLDPALRARAELAVHGPDQHDPAYQARLVALATEAGARLGGRLARAEVLRELAQTDLLVVPSLWYENSPLVIYEALAARTPLLVSDQGGMAELVQDGVTGFHFRQGDAADLARALGELIRDPSRLPRLDAAPLALSTVVEHVDRVVERYRRLVLARPRP
jgi:glycosyltransferase involved in cell wall biosynthesis